MVKIVFFGYDYRNKNKSLKLNFRLFKMEFEVDGGFEPPYAVLQTAA